jgi:hypothetical protein
MNFVYPDDLERMFEYQRICKFGNVDKSGDRGFKYG